MQKQQKIANAFESLHIQDPLNWLREHVSDSLVEQNNVLLKTGVAPFELRDYYKRWSLQHARFDEFAKLMMVNHVRTQHFGWSLLFDPFTRGMADAIWTLLQERIRDHGYVPKDDGDTEIALCFNGVSLAPPLEALEYQRVEDYLWEILEPSGPTSEEALETLGSHPKGYRLLYALIAVDGQVCNGGFEQLHDNGGQPCVEGAVETLELWDRPQLAAVVRRAKQDADEFDALNEEYYRLRKQPDADAFELDLWLFPTKHPRLFVA